jgi:hypothetical protein
MFILMVVSENEDRSEASNWPTFVNLHLSNLGGVQIGREKFICACVCWQQILNEKHDVSLISQCYLFYVLMFCFSHFYTWNPLPGL